MPDTPELLDLRSHDISADRLEKLLELFPEVRTEGVKLDFERLKLALGERVDAGRERYGLTWPGKADCFTAVQTPSTATLRPAPDESIDFDTTENLIIEGDNLEVLKLLQKSYLGQVKVIYIDPPYNTGNDFIYPDNYSESLQTYLEYTGQVDTEGRKFSSNTDTDGRFHSRWLNMMWPRLFLARNLLRDDGLIFVSIDSSEIVRLRALCDEIFGDECFVEEMVWKNKYNAGAKTRGFSNVHEYVLCYSRTPEMVLSSPLSEEAAGKYTGVDDKFAVRGGYVTQPLATSSKDPRPNLRYPIVWEGQEIWPDQQWIWSRERVEAAVQNDEVVVNETDGKMSVRVKQYLRDDEGVIRRTKPLSIAIGPYNQAGTAEVSELLGTGVFGFPKPSKLIRRMLSISVGDVAETDGIVLDFFAGSGSTAHAVLDLNKEDGGNRKFILVQLPEPTGRDDYPTIAEITKERVRRVAAKLNDAEAGELPLEGTTPPDRGFKVFKLAKSNFTAWDAGVNEAKALAEQLNMHVDHIREGRNDSDLLAEIILKSGLKLSAPVEQREVAGKMIHLVGGDTLLVCLDRQLTLELVREIAALAPARVVCLDAGFAGNDQLKANAVHLFRERQIVLRTV